MRRTTRIRLILAILAIAGSIATFLWLLSPRFAPEPKGESFPVGSSDTLAQIPSSPEEPSRIDTVPGPPDSTSGDIPDSSLPGLSPTPPSPDPGMAGIPSDTLLAGTIADTLQLMIPVAGVDPGDLIDTYTDARSEGRVHNALDIMAPQGTPVLAATDGTLLSLFPSELGGITLYQRGLDGRLIYYYAHLDRYADGITEGMRLRRGDLIGYVGNTGNAGPGNYHLHFAIWLPADPARYWDGITINPYPILRRSPHGGTVRGLVQRR